jgi:hypothetical protein
MTVLSLIIQAEGQIFVVPNINPNDKNQIIEYVNKTYPDYPNEILKTIEKESSFRPNAQNPKSAAFGFMGIMPDCSWDLGYAFDLVRDYWYINIHVGYLYLEKCLKKANYDYEQAYLYYSRGLNYKNVENEK